MSIFSKIKSVFSRKKPQRGTIFLKPSEEKYAKEVAKKSGVTVSIPEKKVTYTPTSKGEVFVSGGGGGRVTKPSDVIPKGSIKKEIQKQEIKYKVPEKFKPSSVDKEQQEIKEQRLAYVKARQFQKGTQIKDYELGRVEVHPPGTIYEAQTGFFEMGGKKVPIKEVYVVGRDWASRKATEKEIKEFHRYKESKAYEETALEEPPSKVSRIFGEMKGRYEKLASQELYDEEATKRLFGESKAGKAVGGLVTGIVPATKGELIGTGIIAGATAGFGYVSKGIIFSVSRIPRVGSYVSKGFKIGEVGLGAYAVGSFGISKAGEFSYATGISEKAEVVGEGIREFGAGIFGYRAGSKAFDVTKGLIETRGKEFIEIPKGEYPAAPPETHLKLFRKNIYEELGKEAGAFHATSEKFWKKELIPGAGTSELKGLYGSTMISTSFTRISGGKYKLFPSSFKELFKELFSVEGRPAVAFLKPRGFREVEIGWSKTPLFEGQKYVKRKGYAYFKQPPKLGFAEVPKMKTEIEAVFRPEAGKYLVESQKHYVKIKGVRVPLDVVRFGKIKGGITKEEFAGKYPGYTEKPLITPEAGLYYEAVASYSYTPPSFVSPAIKISSSEQRLKPSSRLVTYSRGLSSRLSKASKKLISSQSFTSSRLYLPSSKRLKPSSKLFFYSRKRVLRSLLAFPLRPSYQKYSPIKVPLKGRPVMRRQEKFPVQIRRFGRWKIIGYGKTPLEAVKIGKSAVIRTLAATFKVPSFKGIKLKGFKTKKTKEGILFIEPKKRRLKRGTLEIPEIQYFKAVKGRKKKKKVKGGL